MSTLTELFSGSPAQRIGWALIHFLWQGAAVALVLAVLLTLLRRRSAQARWVLSCAALALLAVLPVATALTVSVEAPGRSGSAPTAGAAYSVLSTGVSVELQTGPASPPQPEFAQSPQPSQATPLPAQPAPTAPAEQFAAVSWHRQLQGTIQPALPWAILAWLAGVIVMSVWHFGGWLQVRRMRRLGTRPAGAVVQEMFDRVLQRLGVRRPVRLLESVRMAVPAAVGWLRPVVLLPVGAVTGLTPQQLEAILAHELAHVRRWDCLVQALAAVTETLLFYHPAVWWVCRQIRQESEQCCDDLAVGICGDRRGYAHALAKVAELGARRPAFAAAATGGKLLPRIRRLLGADRPGPLSLGRCLSGVLALVTIIAIAIAVGVSCSSAESQAEAADKPATQAAEAAQIGRLIKQLGSENYKEREGAEAALMKIGLSAVPALAEAAGHKNPEIATRADRAWAAICPARVKLIHDRDEYLLGENIIVHFQLENVGTTPVRYEPGGFYPAHRLNDGYRVTATVMDETGKPSPGQVEAVQMPDSWGGKDGEWELKPGERREQTLYLSRYLRFVQPGRYKVRIANVQRMSATHTEFAFGQMEISLKLPTPAQAKEVYERMKTLPSEPVAGIGERRNDEISDFEGFLNPVYMPILEEYSRKGNPDALSALGKIRTAASVKAIVALVEEALNKSNVKLGAATFKQLGGSLPDPRLYNKAYGDYYTIRRRYVKQAWRPEYAQVLRRLAAGMARSNETVDLADISFIYECVGLPEDLADLALAYTKSIEATKTLPFETHQYFRPRGSAYSFRFSTAQLLSRGAKPSEDPKSTGEMAIYIIAIKTRKDFRPKDWIQQVVKWLGCDTPYMRELILDYMPEPMPQAVLDILPKLLADDYVDLQIAACHVAAKHPDTRYRQPLLEILRTGKEDHLLEAAAAAAKANSATQAAVSIGFGPVVESFVRVPTAKSDTFLDLEAGKLFAHDDSNAPKEPTMSKELSQTYHRARWAKGSGADICLPPDGRFGKDVTGLVGLDMRMLPTKEPFDRLTPRDAAKALAGRDYYMLNDMQCAVGELPATFLVETREGHLGVVQVAGVSDNPPGLRVRYKMAPVPVDFGLEEPLWITLAPFEPTVKSLRALRVLADVRSLNQQAGRSGEWEIRTADNARRISRLPYRWSIRPDQLLPDGKRILGGTNRKGRFGLDESQLRRVGAMAKGDYLLAWYVAGRRCSNVMAFRIDPACDSGALPLLELAEIETGPGRRLPVLVLRARRHAESDPAPLASDVAHATLNVDGQDRTLSSFLWAGGDSPLRVGDHYTYLLDLKWWTWDPQMKQAAPPIDPNKPHVIFGKVGRDKVQQTPPIRVTCARTLGEAWDLATPTLARVSSPEASISLSGSVFDLQGKPGAHYEVMLVGGDKALFREKADVAGKYRFSRIPPGTYRLVCHPPRMGQPELAIRSIVIQAGKTTLKDVSLAGKFILAGRVTDADGKPIPKMTVDLGCMDRQAGAEFMDTTRTDGQGRYRLASPLGTVGYIGVNGGRINGDMPRLSVGENAVDFLADKGRFRAAPGAQPASNGAGTQPAATTQPAPSASSGSAPTTQPTASDETTKPFVYKLKGPSDAASLAIINRIFGSGAATAPATQPTTAPAASTKPGMEASAAEAAEIERLIRRLGSERFAEREEAQKALMEIGAPAAAALEKAASDADTERATRSKAILAAMRRETARLALARKGRICAYLTAKAPDTGGEAEKMALGDLEDLKLQEEPLLGDGDFTQYDAKGHWLRLTDKALAKFPKKVDVWGVPFVVVVDGRRWYMGSFYNPSSSYRGPAPNTTIDLIRGMGDRGLATPPDRDPDPAILAVLQTLGGGATTTPASEPASPAAEIERLIKQLGSEKVAEREAAQQALVKIGPSALPALQTATKDKDAERAVRANRALESIQRYERIPETVSQVLLKTYMLGKRAPIASTIPLGADEFLEDIATDGRIAELLQIAAKGSSAERSRLKEAVIAAIRKYVDDLPETIGPDEPWRPSAYWAPGVFVCAYLLSSFDEQPAEMLDLLAQVLLRNQTASAANPKGGQKDFAISHNGLLLALACCHYLDAFTGGRGMTPALNAGQAKALKDYAAVKDKAAGRGHPTEDEQVAVFRAAVEFALAGGNQKVRKLHDGWLAATEPTTQPAPNGAATQPALKPPVEQVFLTGVTGWPESRVWFDLDSGKFVGGMGREKPAIRGADLHLKSQADVVALNMTIAVALFQDGIKDPRIEESDSWIGNASNFLARAKPMGEQAIKPKTAYFFRTADGSVGALRVADEFNKYGVIIKYRVVQPAYPWGRATGGVQARLCPDKSRWDAGQTPTFRADIRNSGTAERTVAQSQELCELELDGNTYRWAGEIAVKSSAFPPERLFDDIRIRLEKSWRLARPRVLGRSEGFQNDAALTLAPGKHTLRVRFFPESAGGGARNVVVETNTVEFEILQAPASPAATQPAAGASTQPGAKISIE